MSERSSGITAGILATARNFGMVLGATFAAVFLSLFFRYYSGGLQLELHAAVDGELFLQALKATFTVVAGISFLGCLVSFQRD